MTPESLARLMAEIESGDPLDYGALSLADEEARRLMALHFCELDGRLREQGLGEADRLEIMAAIAAHAMVENMLLQTERLAGADAGQMFERLMNRLRATRGR